ncbi:MAG: S1 RNA-binding domain-containing protein [Oscillospiraceae bacterium]
MQIEAGIILEGKIATITKFGAFIDFENGKTGMVHISEVSNEYVEDISQHLKKGDVVKVKVLSISEEGKISLSIKKALPKPPPKENKNYDNKNSDNKNFENKKPYNKQKSNFSNDRQSKPQSNEKNSFEDMLKKFQQSSDEKLSDLKRSTNNKQGSAGYSRRGR